MVTGARLLAVLVCWIIIVIITAIVSPNYCPSAIAASDGYDAAFCNNMKLGDVCTVSCAAGFGGNPEPSMCTKNTTRGYWSTPTGCTRT